MFRDQSYAVLARHTLEGYKPEQARIPVHDGFTDFFAFDHSWQPRGTDDCHDLLLLRLTTTVNHDNWLGTRALIDAKTPRRVASAFVPGGDLVISGYPGIGLNEVDYQRDAITNQRFIVQCEYRHATEDHVHMLQVHKSAIISTFGGYSGGLVLARTSDSIVPAGVVITGSADRNLMRFVDVTALYLSSDNFVAQLDAA